jgi:hypothetical protein
MLIIGCDLHTRNQQIAMLDTETGELVERRLEHESGEARAFYASLPRGARVGIEATAPARWFERLLAEFAHELWVGDAAKIRAQVVRQQKTDDALAAGGGGADGGAIRPRVASPVPALEVSSGVERGQSGHRPCPGGEVVLDAAERS